MKDCECEKLLVFFIVGNHKIELLNFQSKMKFDDVDCKNPKKQTRNKKLQRLQNDQHQPCADLCRSVHIAVTLTFNIFKPFFKKIYIFLIFWFLIFWFFDFWIYIYFLVAYWAMIYNKVKTIVKFRVFDYICLWILGLDTSIN